MGKPEIIGYEPDPDQYWSSPSRPEMTFDSDGISIPWTALGADGNFFTYRRYLKEYEIDPFMRKHGMKRIYKERPFWAKPAHDGYWLNGWRLYCKRCQTVTMSTKRLPHDLADAHRCLYNPDDKE